MNRPDWRSASRAHPSTRWRTPATTPTTTPSPPLGRLIEGLRTDTFAEAAKRFQSSAVISDCSAIASYSWLGARDPTILVPGMTLYYFGLPRKADDSTGRPPRWTPLAEPMRLSQDSGQYFRDRNAARYPKYPLEPAIIAGFKMSPDLCRDGEVDVVACGSTVGNLLRFVRGKDKPYRILVDMVGETVFFIRRENPPAELIPDVRGFGHTFPEAYTTWDADVRGSQCHERLLRYNFGDLRFLLRASADGYMRNAASGRAHHPVLNGDKETSKIPESISTVTEWLGDTFIAPGGPTNVTAGLKVRNGGTLVEQSSLFELKTRSLRKKEEDTLGEELPRLWARQVPNFILAHHEKGLFEDIKENDVRAKVNEWERSHQDDLCRLAALVHHVIDILRKEPHRKIELCYDGEGNLEVREALSGTADALSPEVKTLWINGASADASKEPEDVSGEPDDSGSDDVLEWKDEGPPDFTACSAACGYCGLCRSPRV